MLSYSAASENAHFTTGRNDHLMVGFHFFSIGMGSECYTIVLQGDLDGCAYALEKYFTRVTYLRTEQKERRDWHGNRKIMGYTIKACYFSGIFAPRRTKPLVEPSDMETEDAA